MIKVLAVSDISPSKLHLSLLSPKTMEAMRHSLTTLGQITPIVVRHTPDEIDPYELIDGNVRLEALRQAGIKTVHAVVLVEDTSDDIVRQMTLALNLVRAEQDHVVITDLLGEMAKTHKLSEIVQSMPWDAKDTESYVAKFGFNWREYVAPPREQQFDFGAQLNDDDDTLEHD